jgi:hypothetical protein
MHYGSGVAVRDTNGERLRQAIGAGLIAVAGHSWWAVPNTS